MRTSFSRHQEPCDFCIAVAPDASSRPAPSALLDISEPPIALWHRQSDRLLSFNGAFAALVEYSPAELLADFHCAQLDRDGRLNGVSRIQPSTIGWVFETGRRRPKSVTLTIIPLCNEILWLPRELQREWPSSNVTQPPHIQIPTQPHARSSGLQRGLVKVRSNNKRPWAEAIIKFDLKVSKEKESPS